MPGREDYEERRQARIDRLNGAAERERGKSEADYQRSHDLVKDIPFGQPNIIGRPGLPRVREMSRRAFERGMEHADKAEYYAEKAEAAENNSAISSDDPAAIEKLEAKIAALKRQQEFMKDLNKYYRKNKTCVGFEGLSDEEAREMDARIMKEPERLRTAFQSFELTSVSQRIKAAEARIAKLHRIDAMPAETIPFDGGEIESDPETNRVIIRFDERQSQETTDNLKGWGFHWSPSMGAWTRMRNQSALNAAKRICGVI